MCCSGALLSVKDPLGASFFMFFSGENTWQQNVQLCVVVCRFLDEDDQPVSRRNFMKILKTGGRFGKRRRPSRKKKPIIRTKTLFIFSPENR